ncbi:MAG: type VII secretion integral membrane protein EccD [Mycobacterium sp.]
MSICRISVAAPSGVVDVTVPTSAPLVTYLAALTELVDNGGTASPVGSRPARPTLCRVDGSVVDPALSLADNAVADGDVLVLTYAEPHRTAPTSFDATRALAAPDPLPAMAAATDPFVTAGCGATGLAALWIAGIAGTGGATVIAAAAAAVCVLAGAAPARRAGRVQVVLWCTTVSALCGTAGFFAVPGDAGMASAMLAVTAAGAAAVLAVHLARCPVSTAVAVAVAAAASSAAGLGGLLLPGQLTAVGAALTLLGLCCGCASARVAMRVVGISAVPPGVSGGGFGVVRPDRAARARAIAAGLAVGWSVAVGTGVAVTALGTWADGVARARAVAFGAMVAAALLLRNRIGAANGIAAAIGGTTSAAAVVILAAGSWPAWSPWLGTLAIALASAFAVKPLLLRGSHPPSVARGLDLLAGATLAATVPLALWVCDAYSLVRGLDLV